MVSTNEIRTFHPLPERGVITIGRANNCEVRIADPLVAFRHLRIYIGASFEIEDLYSSNGTRVAGRSLVGNKRITIVPGEEFVVGTSTLIVQPR